MILVTATLLLGLVASWVLFNRFPGLEQGDAQEAGNNNPQLSVIIPARNEEKNLALLLTDLQNQTRAIHEIICVDDDSTDHTASIVGAYRATLITAASKPDGWLGKTWACQQGGEAASGELLLFLDADVRLSPTALSKLLRARQKTGIVVSVMPYHRILKTWEALSFFFNCLQMGANGLGLSSGLKTSCGVGLYGPVILIDRGDYQAVGGHAAIKDCIVDDVALGEKLRDKAIPFALFLGDHDISYRMYGGGLRDLIDGWTKNQAAGVARTPLFLIVLVFFWITAAASAPLYLVLCLVWQQWLWGAIMTACYGIWVLELTRIARQIGSFSVISIVCYPLLLLFYLGIFLRSLAKKILGRPVIWKDRKIRLDK
ncbi:glycosyltransferase [Acetobacterium wieringae]|uniref:glycosyltransferase n=1 Tax=Acetobacterium wieringae TaxID=52694 RepID=UPI0031593CB3